MYNPKIYIRDYQATEYRMLAFKAEYDLDGMDVELRRALFLRAEGPPIGAVRLKLSGDQQSGADVLRFSGDVAGPVFLTHSAALHLHGGDVTFVIGSIYPVDTGSFALTGKNAEFVRALIDHAGAGPFTMSVGAVDLRRDLLLRAEPATFSLVGKPANITSGMLFGVDPGIFEMTANSPAIVAHYLLPAETRNMTVAGQNAQFLRSLVFAAEPANFALAGNSVEFSESSHFLLSGDQQSGADRIRLSGDQQDGTDTLIISE